MECGQCTASLACAVRVLFGTTSAAGERRAKTSSTLSGKKKSLAASAGLRGRPLAAAVGAATGVLAGSYAS